MARRNRGHVGYPAATLATNRPFEIKAGFGR
jgi:hypothetical protein